jgi:C4-dicarboxylate-binding protein DctP
MKFLATAATALALTVTGAAGAMAACDEGEVVIKLSHVTNTDKHPKGLAASLLQQRVNDEMNGKACMEVYPNSTLYNDDQVLEAMLQGDVQISTCPSCSRTWTLLTSSRTRKPVRR